MPFDVMPYTAKMADHGFVPLDHESPKYFDVQAQEIYDSHGTAIAGHKVIKRMDTGDSLAVHTDAYAPILDKDIFDAFESGLNRSGLNIDGLLVGRDRSHNGARMFCQYVLPNEARIINGAPVSLRFVMWNTHDASRAASGRVGYLNWVCANTCVTGQTLDTFSVTHKGKDTHALVTFKIEGLIVGAKNAIERLARMEKWTRFPVLDATAVEVFNTIPGVNKTLVGDLSTRWLEAKGDGGPNGGDSLWSLHNVLTGWATHNIGKGRNVANALVERQERVGKAMAGPVWTELEFAAA